MGTETIAFVFIFAMSLSFNHFFTTQKPPQFYSSLVGIEKSFPILKIPELLLFPSFFIQAWQHFEIISLLIRCQMEPEVLDSLQWLFLLEPQGHKIHGFLPKIYFQLLISFLTTWKTIMRPVLYISEFFCSSPQFLDILYYIRIGEAALRS